MLDPGTIEAFQLQAVWCHRLGSSLYGTMLEHCAENIEAGGVLARLLSDWTGKPFPDALPLRLMGAVHDRVLSGDAPRLARFYPSTGGSPAWPDAWTSFLDAVEQQGEILRPRLWQAVQTNEVNRSAPLLGGFLEIAARTGLPLCLREIGSSAGLNQFWDQFRYELGEHRWGDPGSPVFLRCAWQGNPPRLAERPQVNDRRGCDLAPVDVTDVAQARRLESFVWPDQLDRLTQLRAAIALARERPPVLDRSTASEWLQTELSQPRAGMATVVFHSIFWWYLSEEEKGAVTEAIEQAGQRATAEAPLAWLRLEIAGAEGAELRLRLWPPDDERLLATSDPHGRQVTWGT